MDPTAIFWFIYSFYSATFIWNFYLTLRQYNVYRKTETRPEEVYEIISEEDFGYHRNYYLDKLTFDSYKLIILFCNLIPWLWSICGRYGLFIKPESGESFQSVLFILFYAFIEGLIELPFSYYETFYIDLKHGTKNETVSFFFIDRAKKFCLILLISSPLVAANAWIVQEGGQYSYIYVWAFVSVYLMLMAFIYPDVIAPLFDKYTPLQESELKTKIEALANKIGFPLKNIYVVEESKRSTHSNAYIFGFWKNKKIVLYDTLLGEEMNKSIQADQKTESETTTKTSSETFEEETNSKTTNKTLEGESLNMQHDEIVAILGHELGHWCEYHSMWMFIFAELNMLLVFFVFGSLHQQSNLYLAFGFLSSAQQPSLIGILLVSQYVFAPYNELMYSAACFMKRRCEFAADAFAARLGFVSQLSTGLVKLEENNLSSPINDWLYSACKYSHPQVIERLEVLRKFM